MLGHHARPIDALQQQFRRHPTDLRRIIEHGGQRRVERNRLVGADDTNIASGLDAAGPERSIGLR